MSYRAWHQELSAGQVRPWYVITGEETFLIQAALSLLKQQIISPGCENLDLVKIREDHDPDRLLTEITTIPFLSPRRLVIVYQTQLFSGKGGSSQTKISYLQQLAAALHDQVCLVMVEEQVDARKKSSLKILQESGGVRVDVGKESSESLMAWLSTYFHKQNLRIRQDAAESLILRCDQDLGQLIYESKKLAQYCRFAGLREVEYNLVDLCCREDLQGNIFHLTDALSKGYADRSILILHKLLKQNEPALLILFMLARHFRQLLAAKDAPNSGALSRGLGLPAFVSRRIMGQAKAFSHDRLFSLCELCYATDYAIKTGDLEPEMALQLILFSAIQEFHRDYTAAPGYSMTSQHTR